MQLNFIRSRPLMIIFVIQQINWKRNAFSDMTYVFITWLSEYQCSFYGHIPSFSNIHCDDWYNDHITRITLYIYIQSHSPNTLPQFFPLIINWFKSWFFFFNFSIYSKIVFLNSCFFLLLLFLLGVPIL